MNWTLIWEFAAVLVPALLLMGGVVNWLINEQSSLLSAKGTEYSHRLAERVAKLEELAAMNRDRLAVLDERQTHLAGMKETLDRFGEKLDAVTTKLEVVADRLERRVNGKQL